MHNIIWCEPPGRPRVDQTKPVCLAQARPDHRYDHGYEHDHEHDHEHEHEHEAQLSGLAEQFWGR